MSDSIFRARPRTKALIYFWPRSGQRGLESECHKASRLPSWQCLQCCRRDKVIARFHAVYLIIVEQRQVNRPVRLLSSAPPLPLIIIPQPESWCSFYRPQRAEGRVDLLTVWGRSGLTEALYRSNYFREKHTTVVIAFNVSYELCLVLNLRHKLLYIFQRIFNFGLL